VVPCAGLNAWLHCSDVVHACCFWQASAAAYASPASSSVARAHPHMLEPRQRLFRTSAAYSEAPAAEAAAGEGAAQQVRSSHKLGWLVQNPAAAAKLWLATTTLTYCCAAPDMSPVILILLLPSALLSVCARPLADWNSLCVRIQ
jgi:hypothetical protein